MRYDTVAIFQLVEYTDQANGDKTETVAESHTEYVSAMGTDLQTMHLVYGAIRQGSITIHLQNKVTYSFNRIVIDGDSYVVDDEIDLRVKQVFVLSKCQA